MEQLCCTVCKFQVPVCLGVLHGRPLSNHANIGDARQATSKGRSCPVETGLTRPAATVLHKYTLYFTSYMYRWKVIQLSSEAVYVAML